MIHYGVGDTNISHSDPLLSGLKVVWVPRKSTIHEAVFNRDCDGRCGSDVLLGLLGCVKAFSSCFGELMKRFK